MPIANLRNQVITYWTLTGIGGDGNPSYSTPVVTKGRWEDRVVLIDEGTDRERLSSNSRVWLQESLKNGDCVYLGTSVSAVPDPDARRVTRIVNIPSVSARVTERVHYLD